MPPEHSQSQRGVSVGVDPPGVADGALWWDTDDAASFAQPGAVVLFDQTLAAAAASFDTGATIPAGYAALQILLYGRSDTAAGTAQALLQFNGDAGANYDEGWQRNSGNTNNASTSTGTTAVNAGYIPAATATANYFGSSSMFIPNYTGTAGYKSGEAQYGQITDSGAGVEVWNLVFSWRNTAAINRLKMTLSAGNFVAGSRMVVLGIGPGSSVPAAPGADGWTSDVAETWTYASASTFTVAGDATAKYTVGTRIKLVQNGTVAYFVVTAASVSAGTTTVTITGGTDYTLANAAISGNSHSYQANPQGYPGWFNYTPTTLTGWSPAPTGLSRFAVVGRMMTIELDLSGTSNGSTVVVGTPAVVTTAYASAVPTAFIRPTDNGSNLTSPGFARPDSGASTITIFKDLASGGWTSSGTKRVQGTVTVGI